MPMTSLDGGPPAGVVFDKDGTLLDFHLTWDLAMGAALSRLAPSAAALEGAARAIGYDLARQRVEPSSQLIAESNATIMALLEPWLDTSTYQRVLDEEGAGRARPAAAADALLDMLGAASVVLGLVTNDSEAVARRQLADLGWESRFAAVVGYDSGYGEKPDPGPVHAALVTMGVPGAAAAMVGDSRHDLVAARAAGVTAVYVGGCGDLAALADISVADLAELAAVWT
jgi:phosphoglycolate phosphatase